MTAHTGTVKTWNDARGFGFVQADVGDDPVFLHIKALPPGSPRPQVGDRVRYERVLSADLKPRAAGARLLPGSATPRGDRASAAARSAAAGPGRTQPAPRSPPPRSEGPRARRKTSSPSAAGQPPRRPRPTDWTASLSLLGLGAFSVVFVLCSVLWPVPGWLASLYPGLSALTYVVYAMDKRAAQAGAWRVSERTLLLLGLAGGWPGAIVAQQRLRHKSSKTAFLALFWVTVVLNIVAFVALVSPWGQALWVGL